MNEIKDSILKPTSIFLSTAGKSGGTNSDPEFNLNNVYNLENVKYITVNSIEIPNVFPNIRTGQNDTLIIEDTTNLQTLTVTLSQGFYTSADLTTKLKTEFDSKSAHAVTFTFTVDQKTAKVTVTASAGNIRVRKTPISNMAETLGFTQDSASANAVTGDSGLDLIPTSCVYVTSSSFGNCSYTWRGLSNVICKFPVNVYYGGIIYYKVQDLKMDLIPVQNINMNSFSFKLYYDDFTPVNLGNYNWSISITAFK
jgi:hypothetical protein